MALNIPKEVKFREFLFDRIAEQKLVKIPEHLFNNAELRIHFVEDKALQFFTEVAGKKDKRSTTIGYATVKYPDGWWESFKERWFPQWLLERFPVQYKEEKIKREVKYKITASFPDIEIPKLADEKYIQFFDRVINEKQTELERQLYYG